MFKWLNNTIIYSLYPIDLANFLFILSFFIKVVDSLPDARNQRIALLLSSLPHTSGVYIIKSKEGEIIYIGKALNLRKRVQQHFRRNPVSPKSRGFMKSLLLKENAYHIEVIETSTEKEALLLEWNLIQEHSPTYNTKWKDGKSFPYLQITAGERFPRVFLSRTKRNKDSIYLGPFAITVDIRNSIRYALRLFPIANCHKEIHQGDHKTWAKTCIRRRTNRCFKPCEVEFDVGKYRSAVGNFIKFIEGKQPELILDLKNKMKKMSEQENYEQAAEIRDVVVSLERSFERQTVIFENIDTHVLVSSMVGRHLIINLALLKDSRVIRQNPTFVKVISSRESALKNDKFANYENDDYKDLEIQEGEIPDFIFHFVTNLLGVDPNKQEVTRIINGTNYKETADKIKNLGFKVVKPKSSDGKLIKLVLKNAEGYHSRQQFLLETTAVSDKKVIDLQKFLGMKVKPSIIDVFDVSTLQGSNNVASCIRFVNGKPWKKGYRRFSINVEGQDDFASIAEAVFRRYKGVKSDIDQKGLKIPDLIVIDGGKEQLKKAQSSINAIGLDILIVGLAKKEEEIYFTDLEEPEKFDKFRLGMLLLRYARDEAHRFAVNYHRLKRDKEMFRSTLDDIKGIGAKRKSLLLKKYKTIANVAKASNEVLTKELGIPAKVAAEVIMLARNFMDDFVKREKRRTYDR